MAVSDWSTTAASNTSVGGISIAENMTRANVNDAMRGMMAELKTYFGGLADAVYLDAYGATYTGDESTIAQAMLDDIGVLRVPIGRTLTAKNLVLDNGARVEVAGTLKLPNGCSDNDRLIKANGKTGLEIYINEIDGNASGQSGALGTHLITLVDCIRPKLHVRRAHDHYVNSSATMSDTLTDGRTTSTGAIWLNECTHATVLVEHLEGWGREGVWLEDCTDSTAWLLYSLGTGVTEYSSIQVSGARNKLLTAHSENAGASGVGFDTTNGVLANVYVKDCREQHGVNFGHPGKPADGSVANNIVVDGAWVGGIRIGSATADLTITGFSVEDAERGLQASDSAPDVRFVGGVVKNSGRWNTLVSATEVVLEGVKSTELDDRTIQLTTVTGQFVAEETITGPSGTGVVRRVLNNLTGAKQRLYMTSVTGTISAAETVTGDTSGASGTVEYSEVPLQYLEQTGGHIVDSARTIVVSSGTYVKHPNGLAEFDYTVSISATATVDATGTYSFPSNMPWAAAPTVQATVATGDATINELRASSTTSLLTVTLNAATTTTYTVAVVARGRWK